MRFRQSQTTNRPPAPRAASGDAPSSSPVVYRVSAWRRFVLHLSRHLSRWILLTVVIGGALAFYVANRLSVRAPGLVSGNLTPVTSLFEARVVKTLVACNSSVKKGQPVVELDNAQLTMRQEGGAFNLASRLSRTKSALDVIPQQVMAAQAQHAAALARERRTHEQWITYDRLYAKDAVGKSVWQSARADWDQAKAEAMAAEANWLTQKAKLAEAEQDHALAQSMVSSDPSQQGRSQSLTDLTVYSPQSGVIVACKGKVGDVARPGVDLYQIFDPEQAYVTMYVSPDDARRLSAGMVADVTVRGGSLTRKGKVAWVEPAATELPHSLRRYFWQNIQWSQYTPVRIALDPVRTADESNQLGYNSPVDVSIRL